MKNLTLILTLLLCGCGSKPAPAPYTVVSETKPKPVAEKSSGVVTSVTGCVECVPDLSGNVLSAPFADKQSNPTKEEKERAAHQTETDKLAREKEKEVLAESSKTEAEYAEAYNADKSSYSFTATKWGHWLELKMARWDGKKLDKYSTSVNLDTVTTLRLEPGHAPDKKGSVYYSRVSAYDEKLKKFKEVTQAHYSTPPWHEPMFLEIKPAEPNMWGSAIMCCPESDYISNLRTENYPEPADDDQIHLDGVAVIYTPAGLGEGVYRKILEAKEQP